MSARNIIHNSLEELFESRAKKYFLYNAIMSRSASVDDVTSQTYWRHLKTSKEYKIESEEKINFITCNI